MKTSSTINASCLKWTSNKCKGKDKTRFYEVMHDYKRAEVKAIDKTI